MRKPLELLYDLFLFENATQWVKRTLLRMTGLDKSSSQAIHFAFLIVSYVIVVSMTIGVLWGLILLLMMVQPA